MRRRSGSRVIMMALWLAYLSADTVAIFVLGHLAVYDTITAFSKQDNELWTRHLLSLVSQVAMAGYVVSKSSWPDARLRAAMVLAFFRGFFKYAGRTLCLYYSSPKSLRALSLGSVSDSIERLGHGMSGARRMIEEIFEIMFVADMCWKFVGRMTGGLTFPDLIHIMSVDAVGPAPVTDDLKLLVLDKLLLQTCRQEWDIASFRGERALEKWMGSHQVPETRRSGYAALHMSVSSRVEFPRSVLILHIATDICYFSEDTETDEAKKKKMMSRELSLYIMYLVFKCDVMLTSISRLAHEQAHEELKEIISGRQSPQGNLDEKEAIMEVIEAMKKEEQQKGSMLKVAHPDKNEEPASKDAAATTSRSQELRRWTEEVIYTPVLSRVYAVARELMAIDDEASRWDLISEVWLEVLFYTAPRCGAAFHYEHLSTGGEFISHVLHLMRLLCPFMPNPGA
ncbi:hypothetical protein SETIT_8G205900v2 [Setaria italica]|uniref:DUF4220 domain-containing protein n=1 Tax=Setaria italica TaxID=4555 RepID=A0A368SBK5_SETIT|nr:hypothetical protein SETIT_8G205900v2 [Setaria italica]